MLDALHTPVTITSLTGEVIATGVTEADYLEQYAENYCEWVEGAVIKMSPATRKHNQHINYLGTLLETYLALRPIGEVVFPPFVLRMPTIRPRANREPDLMLILHGNAGELTETTFTGAPDIVIEIVSEESSERDRGTKFNEYEKIGAREYWLFDSRRREALFYHLNDVGVFVRRDADATGIYTTPLLPDLHLHIAPLWQDTPPNPIEIVATVKAMLGDDE
ncbi:MAG: Uma2 family endonuclease [Anaerolineae bacterium]|nr:Uma2 family endonuclease [Anaerolineae bacterium]